MMTLTLVSKAWARSWPVKSSCFSLMCAMIRSFVFSMRSGSTFGFFAPPSLILRQKQAKRRREKKEERRQWTRQWTRRRGGGGVLCVTVVLLLAVGLLCECERKLGQFATLFANNLQLQARTAATWMTTCLTLLRLWR